MKQKLNDEIFKKWNFDVNLLGHEEMLKASVIVPIVFVENEINILFQVRSKNIRQGGEISFPGGKIDLKDKSFSDTAIRETCEELGISKEQIEVKAELDTLISPFNSVIKAYIAFINILTIDELNLNKNEVEEVFLVPLKWFYENNPKIYKIYLESHPYKTDLNGKKLVTFPAKELGLPDLYHKSWMNSTRKIYFYNYKNYKIWGFTAHILKDALKKLDILGIKNYI
jgi:8-oxo-dGTP pyrophosphatase MutT (NUDIX family)